MTDKAFTLIELATNPKWWFEGRLKGYRYPCPICQATGEKPTLLAYLGCTTDTCACWHCQGTGDEAAAIHRNGKRI